MGGLRLVERPENTRTLLVAFVFIAVSCATLVAAGRADAGALTGGFSPTIVGGGADVNGDGVVNGSDDANAFYGDTSIIDGKLDCDAWGAVANEGSAGSSTITAADDCSLVGFDGTPDGVTIEVVDGAFQFANGPLPTVFNAGEPNNSDIGDSDFAWSALDGRVDSNGNEGIDGQDCHVGVVDSINVLSNDTAHGDANPCGFAHVSNTADNGLLDFNNDQDVTGADSCSNSCFFGHDVVSGKVQEVECPGYEGDSRHDVIGTSGADVLVGTAGRDIICALGGKDTLKGNGDKDLLLGGGGADDVHGGKGADVLKGQKGKDHLFGNKGNDRLEGGQGSDHCSGGSGNDTFASCEVRHQ